jgi:8-oxo-dGTP pyrophosphatase MutT (NUDIX family)
MVRIAAAVIRDERGRFLLVRKHGTEAFMQAGGKIEPGEQPVAALMRELNEELGLVLSAADARYLGMFEAEAANEPGFIVQAELFDVAIRDTVTPAAEIAEAVWISRADSQALSLAPLTRRHVLNLE